MVAHIRYEGGALLLPAQDPYDRQIVFEEAECCARRHGAVGVQFGHTHMRISRVAEPTLCEECSGTMALLIFVIDHQRMCARCARQRMKSAAVSEPARPDQPAGDRLGLLFKAGWPRGRR